jgi:hypothetical protein
MRRTGIQIASRERVVVRHTTPRWTFLMGVYLEQIKRVTWDKGFEDQANSCQRAALTIARLRRKPMTRYGSLESSTKFWQCASEYGRTARNTNM